MYRLKKIHIGSVALYSFIMVFVLGVLFMLPFEFLNMAFSHFAPMEFSQRHFLFPFGAIFYLFFPFIYALMVTVVNVILVLIYNLLSGPLGGIKFDLKKVEPFAHEEISDISVS